MKKRITIVVLLMTMAMATLSGCSNYAQTEEEPAPQEATITKDNFDEDETDVDGDVATINETDASDYVADNIETDEDITVTMVGDILLHDRVWQSGMLDDGTYNYDHLFANVKEDIEQADIAIVNEEVILGGTELSLSGYPAFNGPHEVADALAKAGFDVACHATNHALDKGSKGICNTIEYWRENYPEVQYVGIHDSEEDVQDNCCYVECKGRKIAILNYTYGTNGIEMPADKPYLVNMLSDEEKVAKDIENARNESDFIIVAPHWGTEYRLEPDNYQKKWAQFFADNNVDLVIGTHPHVIEPVVWYTSNDGTHKTLVYYSLGNFVNATSGTGAGTSDRMLGARAKVTLGADDEGKLIIKEYGAQGLISHIDTTEKCRLTVYPLEEYNDELAACNEILRQDSDFSYEYEKNLWEKVMGDLPN